MGDPSGFKLPENPNLNPHEKVEEWIGGYAIHPLAAAFPLCLDSDFLSSICDSGIQQPIIMDQDGRVVDGRSRLAAHFEECKNNKAYRFRDHIPIETRHFRDFLEIFNFILDRNQNRRHQTEDQRVAVVAKMTEIQLRHMEWERERRQKEGQFKPGQSGNPSGKPKEQVNPNPDSPAPKRDTKKMNANSSRGQLAAVAKVSRHKADQVVAVQKAAPELLDKVIRGEVDLKDAVKQVKPARPKPQPDAYKPKRVTVTDSAMQGVRDLLYSCSFPEVQMVRDWCDQILRGDE